MTSISRRLALTFCASLALASPAAAAVCPRWSPPEKIGDLDPKMLPEASGLAVSRAFGGRLYHHNDSGAGPQFYVTDAAGANPQTVTIDIPKPGDVEDMALGPCVGAGHCLVLGDVGDNSARRPGVSFTVVAEKKTFAETEPALRVIKARYPDGSHNAEGFAIHPSGDLYLVTKVRAPAPTQVFRLTRDQVAVADGTVQTFTEVARFDLAALMKGDGVRATPTSGLGGGGPTVTGFDISADGKRALIMTYRGAAEIAFDLAKPLPPQDQWKAGRDFRVIDTQSLPQAEAVIYSADGKSMIYDSEVAGSKQAPIYRQRCLG